MNFSYSVFSYWAKWKCPISTQAAERCSGAPWQDCINVQRVVYCVNMASIWRYSSQNSRQCKQYSASLVLWCVYWPLCSHSHTVHSLEQCAEGSDISSDLSRCSKGKINICCMYISTARHGCYLRAGCLFSFTCSWLTVSWKISMCTV